MRPTRPAVAQASAARKAQAVGRTRTPEEWLWMAIAAKARDIRAYCARRGLVARRPLDTTTRALLLRQLYLSHYEAKRFDRARVIALRALRLDVLPDVLHQDVARASIAKGDVTDAVAHLRRAARRAPLSRRPFHLWTLGSTLLLLGRYPEACAALERAVRWGTYDKPLYRAHLALARLAMGDHVGDLRRTMEELAMASCGQGYGRFLLGHLAFASGQEALARRYLRAFVRRTETARPALAIALDGELRLARATLLKIG